MAAPYAIYIHTRYGTVAGRLSWYTTLILYVVYYSMYVCTYRSKFQVSPVDGWWKLDNVEAQGMEMAYNLDRECLTERR